MTPRLIEKRVKLHELIKSQWQTIAELNFPKVNHFEYRSGLGVIRVYEEFKADNTLYHIKLRWITGKNKGKLVKSAEIDNLLTTLKPKINEAI
jgi:hypothetical protein